MIHPVPLPAARGCAIWNHRHRLPSVMPHFQILMCTLNGETYLPEQLASFANQNHTDWSLWVSDDGSTDATLNILRAFKAANAGYDIRMFAGPRQGVAANYLSLLARANLRPDMLVALSDQDDIWLPGKLARAATTIATAGSGAGHPTAYAAAQILSDKVGERHRQSRACPAGPSFANALVQNILSGNTLVLNAPALALVQRCLPPDNVPFHDWWIYQLVTGAGGHAIFDPQPALIYRQHESNTLGSNRGLRAIRHRIAMVLGHEYAFWARSNLAALQAAGASLTPENRELLRHFGEGIGQGGLKRARRLRTLGVTRQSRAGTLVLLLIAILGQV